MKSAVKHHTVADSSHRKLSYAEVHISSRIVILGEISHIRHICLSRRCKVSRTAHKVREHILKLVNLDTGEVTIATQVCKRIENEGRTAVDDWKRVLKAGGTKTPVELAAMAGIDITTDAPLLDTIETIGAMIDEICELTDELEDK